MLANVSSVGHHYFSTLGSVCKHQGIYEDAEKLYRYAKEDLDGKPALENEKAVVLLQIASIFIARGKVSEAEEMSRLVLDHTEKADLRLFSFMSLAYVCGSRNQPHKAEQYLKKALDQCEEIFGLNNFRTLKLVGKLATMYRERGQHERAEMLSRRELLSFEARVGSDHPETMMARGRLALLCEKQGKYEEAEALVERSMNARERSLGSEHPNTLNLVASLAVLHDLQGNFEESHPLYVRALEGKERTLGSKHTATLNILENMALRCHMQGEYKEAEEMYHNVLETRLSQAHDNEDIKRIKARLAELYKQQDSDKAEYAGAVESKRSWWQWGHFY